MVRPVPTAPPSEVVEMLEVQEVLVQMDVAADFQKMACRNFYKIYRPALSVHRNSGILTGTALEIHYPLYRSLSSFSAKSPKSKHL